MKTVSFKPEHLERMDLGRLERSDPAMDAFRSLAGSTKGPAKTLMVGSSSPTQVWDTALTADRAVTLSTTGAANGDRFRIVRTANATGAFNLNVGTGPLKAMGTAGSFSDVEYNGTAWILTAYSTL